ncbi:hypothetical protein CcaCcLH18_11979 [Colletotrichum camelliae]|nr:hypothetical protein CcaCcLH18_11979 [Colletotrichum camelliae]
MFPATKPLHSTATVTPDDIFGALDAATEGLIKRSIAKAFDRRSTPAVIYRQADEIVVLLYKRIESI